MANRKVRAAQLAGGRGGEASSKRSTSQASCDPNTIILQQKCLNIFRDAFQPDNGQTQLLQEIKGHLFRRDFSTAFSRPEYLNVYASRWSPSRALGYCTILHDLEQHLNLDNEVSSNYRVVCLGGGAGAEVVALAAWRSLWMKDCKERLLSAVMVDVAGWQEVVQKLLSSVTTEPQLSKYVSAAARENNVALLSEKHIHAIFLQQDILSWPLASMRQALENVQLVTIMFTLNELYSASTRRTQLLLARLTAILQPGSLLLVVDSPGTYSNVTVNGGEKKYPMVWLLAHALLGPAGERGSGQPKWETVLSDDARWYRLPLGLQYPIELENMRYQVHLYRRLADD